MITIAQISDLHFGRTDPAIVDGVLADLAALAPHFIVVSGDLTQAARIREFEAARAFLDRLQSPYLVIPGNHDVPPVNILERFATPFARYRRWITRDICPTHLEPGLAIAGVNTARRFRWKLNWALGSISHHQIDQVERFFAPLGDDIFKIVVTHHPFLPPPDTPDEDLAAHAAEAIPVFERCGVDLILSGHLHRAYTGEVGGQSRAIHRSILVAQASTATSTRVRGEPNAYNLIMIDGNRVGLCARVWDGQGFTQKETAWFEKQSDRWLPVTEAAKETPKV
jgi:3',5'-cyclic AMP phosphodiesterase CpdA